MTFCNNCGYLLPVDFKHKTSLCNPCMQINAISYVAKSCDCEFCYNPLSLSPQNSEQQVDQKPHDLGINRHQNFSSVTGRESDALHGTSVDLDLEENYEEDFNINISYQHEPPGIGYDDDYDMVSSVECESVPDIFSDPYTWTTIHDGDDSLVDQKDDGSWTIVPPRKGHDKCNRFGLQEKKSEGEVRKEDQVSEPLRERWTQEQGELLKKLITKDTCHIARLTSGDRRKSDGSRFYVGGVDISFIKGNNIDACACLSVVQMPNLELVYQRMEMIQLTQPYIPGFLAFREVPPLLKLFGHLKKTAPHYMPNVVMVDGNGILHPRGFGLASHLGVMLDMPTIGVAKTLMTAQGVTDDEEHKKRKQGLSEAGHSFDLISQTNGEVIGRCLRVHDEAPNPIYISVGHKISLESASWIALETSQYRIPEPVRRADLDSREYIRQKKNNPQEYIRI